MEKNYNMSFEEAQDYVSKRGLVRMDILWNDGDIFIDEGDLTRTVGNVLKYADETMLEKICQWLRGNLENYYYLDEAYDQVISVKNVIGDLKDYILKSS